MYAFKVSSSKQILMKILPHFDSYPLITHKRADYLLFKEIVTMMEQGEHLKVERLQAIVNIRASLNLGLSELLKSAFPYTIPVPRPQHLLPEIPHPEWMAGFTTGEGCFFVKILKGRNKFGFGVQIVFQVTQHIRDEELIKSLVTYFQCGQYQIATHKKWGSYICTKFSDNFYKILPFFSQYPIRGSKNKDFLDWVKVAEIMQYKGHLTQKGVSNILEIKKGMNKGRSDQ